MQDRIEIRMPLPPMDRDYFIAQRRRSKKAQDWETQVQLVVKNMPYVPVTWDSDIDVYCYTMCSGCLEHTSGVYYFIERTRLFSFASLVKNIRFHWKYTSLPASQHMWLVVTPHAPSEFPLTEAEKKRRATKVKRAESRNNDRGGILEHPSGPPPKTQPEVEAKGRMLEESETPLQGTEQAAEVGVPMSDVSEVV